MKTKLVLSSLLTLMLGTADSAWSQGHCQRIPVGSRAINACVSGEGARTVVLAAGAGQDSRTWNGLVTELSLTARVITFDRPGWGRSDPSRDPRTPTQIAQELHGVLQALGVEDSVVLVGHSMGGLHVLRYASLFPGRVLGVALLDTPPAGFEEARRALLTREERRVRERRLEEGSARGAAVVRQEREGAAGPIEWDFSAFPREVPLAVVVADSQNFGDLGSAPAHRALWIAKSREWVALSDAAEFLVAEGSGHMIHHDRPALTIAVITRLLERGR